MSISKKGIIGLLILNFFLIIITVSTINTIRFWKDLNITNQYSVTKFIDDVELMSENNTIVLKSKTTNLYKNVFDIDVYLMLLIFLGVLSSVNGFIVLNFIKTKSKNDKIINMGNEAIMSNKSLIMLTENIHHELNTPLEVLENKVEKVKRTIDKYLYKEYKNWLYYSNESSISSFNDYTEHERRKNNIKIIALEEDFKFIKTASSQIHNILEKMKGIKQSKHSNENDNVYKIAQNAVEMVSLNLSFSFKINDSLRHYQPSNELFTSLDLLNIIINHIKNSLEADATNITIDYYKFENNKIYLHIIDNGNGIPMKVQSNIFESNFSTKDSSQILRGNGMYLNKHIANSGGGDVNLFHSDSKGTVIEVIIPCIYKED